MVDYSVDPFTGRARDQSGATTDGAGLPLSTYLPTMAPQRRDQPSILGGGIAAGYQNLVGTGGSALEAVGRATGFGGLERYGRSVADYREGRVQQVGRPDLDTAPWKEGGSPILPWLGYQVAQQVPNLALTAAAFFAGGPAGAAGAMSAGGARGALGATAAALRTSPGAVLAGASMLPQGAGSLYQSAVDSARATTGDREARPGVGEAFAALALSPVYAAAEAIPTSRYLGILGREGVGAGVAARAARAGRGAVEGAATEFVTEGVQTGMEQMFRPDLSLGDRARNVLDGALSGMAVGGVLGGGAGAASRGATRPVVTGDTSNDALTQAVDQTLTRSPLTPGGAGAAQQPDLFGAPPQMTPAEGSPRVEPAPLPDPTVRQQEFPLPAPAVSDNPMLFDEQQIDPGNFRRDAIRQALTDAGEYKDNQTTRQFMGRFAGDNPVDIAMEALALNDARNPPRMLGPLLTGLGFDEVGAPRDLSPAITRAEARARKALTDNDPQAARDAQAELERLTRQQAVQQEVLRRVAERDFQPTPVTEAQSAGAQQPSLFSSLPPETAGPPVPAAEIAPLGLDQFTAQRLGQERTASGLTRAQMVPPLPPQGGPQIPGTEQTSFLNRIPQPPAAAPNPVAQMQTIASSPEASQQMQEAAVRTLARLQANEPGATIDASALSQRFFGGPEITTTPAPTNIAAPAPQADPVQPGLSLGPPLDAQLAALRLTEIAMASKGQVSAKARSLNRALAEGKPDALTRADAFIRANNPRLDNALTARPTPAPGQPAAARSEPAPAPAALPAQETTDGQVQADAVPDRQGREGEVTPSPPASTPVKPKVTSSPKAEAKPASTTIEEPAIPFVPPHERAALWRERARQSREKGDNRGAAIQERWAAEADPKPESKPEPKVEPKPEPKVSAQETKRRAVAARNAAPPAKAAPYKPTQQAMAVLNKIIKAADPRSDLARAARDAVNAPTAEKVATALTKAKIAREDAEAVRVNQESTRKAREAAEAKASRERQERYEGNPNVAPLESIRDDDTIGAPLRKRAERALQDIKDERLGADETARGVVEAADKAQTGTTPPEWARAAGVRGLPVVYWDSEVALQRDTNERTGLPVYIGVSREKKWFTIDDIRQYIKDTASAEDTLFDAEQRERLVAAREQLVAEDQAAFEKAPNGPFSGTQGQVVAGEGVSKNLASYVRGLLDQVNMGDLRVYVVHPGSTKKDRDSLHGPYASALSVNVTKPGLYGSVRQFGPDLRDFYIMLRPDMSDRLTVEVAAHEVGHIIQKVAFNSAPEETQAAIRAGHEAWLTKVKGGTARRLIASLRNQETGTYQAQSASETMLAKDLDGYWTSFSEWFADQTSKWATTQEQPRTLVERFFKSVAEQLTKLARFFVGDRAPTQNVRKFLDEIGPASAQMWRQGQGIRGDAKPQESAAPSNARLAVDTAATSLMKRATAALERTVESAKSGENRAVALRGAVLYVSTLNHIARTYGSLFPVSADFAQQVNGAQNLLENISNINRRRASISARFADLFEQAWNAMEKLPDNIQTRMKNLMAFDAFEIDGRKSFDDQPWLHKKKDQDKYRALVAEANKLWNDLGPDGRKAFDAAVVYNKLIRFAPMTTVIYNTMSSDPATRELVPDAFKTNPMEAFLAKSALEQSTPEKALEYWQQAFDAVLADGDRVWRAKTEADRNRNNTNAAKAFKLKPNAAPKVDGDSSESTNLLATTLNQMRAQAAGVKQKPYFHLGREGDYFLSFAIKQDGTKVGEDKKPLPDPAATARLNKMLEAEGFEDFDIRDTLERNSVFLRVRTPDEMARLDAMLQRMQTSGDIEGLKSGQRDTEEYAAGMDFKFLESAIDRFRASPAFQPPEGASQDEIDAAHRNRDKAISQLKEAWLSMLPETSEARVMTQRKAVGGWSKDMLTSYAFRAHVATLALANQSTSADMRATLGELREQAKKAEDSASGRTPREKLAMKQTVREVLIREQTHDITPGRDWVDTLRAVNYAFFLGLSPSYALNNMTQPYVTLWPELAKTNGYVKSATAIAKAMGQAFKITKAAYSEGIAVSKRAAAEPALTPAVMTRAGVAPDMQEFLLRVVNSGVVDIGGAAREQARLAERNTSGGWDNVLRYASSFGLYSEIVVRLASAIALRNLNNAKAQTDRSRLSEADLVPEAVRIIDDTMFNYSESNIGRAVGRAGVAGRFTPVATAFQQFNLQMMEKLYREFDALATKDPVREKGESDKDFKARQEEAKETRRQGRTWMIGHATAITVLAGSLGLPFVTVAAAVVNRLKDAFDDDDEPFDVIASYRNFLATAFGKEIGEVLARGAPRLINIDTSSRLGEQNILPMSRFLADRREYSDKFKDLAEDALGAPTSMINSIIRGVGLMADGNILAGMQQALPSAVRGPVAAYRMGSSGYFENDKGQRLPMEPGAQDIIAQLFGYAPAGLAEYREANQTQAQRRGVITREATQIRTGLAKAIEDRDQESIREWATRAQAFDRNNPAYAVLPRIGTAVQQRAVARAQADALDVPLGVSMRDVAARDRTAFANWSR